MGSYDEYLLDKNYFIKSIKDLADIVEEKRDYLTDLDSAIGDGDHGVNLSIGFREVMKNYDQIKDKDISFFFKRVGMILLSKVGGSAGPLYGGFFMKFGEPAKNKDVVNFEDLYNMFKVGVESIEKRGKAVIGDKTMVDALRKGLDSFTKSIKNKEEPKKAFNEFYNATKNGAESTIPLIAKKGRAMRLGERAIGHLDPGAASSTIIVEIFKNNLP